jgi:hypothetical protein
MTLLEDIYIVVRAACAEQISAVAAVFKEHSDIIEDLSSRSLLPGQAAQMLKHLSEQHLDDPTPARLESHAAVLASLQAISGNPSVQFSARRAAKIVHDKAEGPLEALRQAVLAAIDREAEALRGQEEAFFSHYNLGWHETPVSRVAVDLRNKTAAHPLWPLPPDQRVLENPHSDHVHRRSTAGLEWLFAAPEKPLPPG